MDKIIEGVVIGVVIAVVLGIGDWTRRGYRRREQIRHIRAIIKKAERDIRGAGPLVPEKGEEHGVVSANQVRFTMYQWLMRELTTTLEDRVGELSYKQKFELRKFIIDQEAFTSTFSFSPNRVPPERFYQQNVFEKLYSLQWLKGSSDRARKSN